MTKPYSKNGYWNSILCVGLDVYVSNWNKDESGPGKVKYFITNSDCAKHILSLIYGYLVTHKKIPAIEDMPVEVLSDLESEALEWQPAATGKQLTLFMKSIWAMNYLLIADQHQGPEFPVMSD